MNISPLQRLLSVGGLAICFFSSIALAQNYTYTPASGTFQWSAGTNWSATPVSGSTTRLIYVGTNSTVISSGTYDSNNDLPGNFTLNILDLQGAQPASGTAVINITGNPLQFTSNGSTTPVINLNATGANLTYNVANNLVLANNMTLNGAGNATYRFSGLISGSGLLTKGNNANNVSLTNNASTFTGGVGVSSGTVFYSSIADNSVASSLGVGTVTNKISISGGSNLNYTGSLDQSSNRTIEFTGSNAASLVTSGSAGTLTFSNVRAVSAGSVLGLNPAAGTTIAITNTIGTWGAAGKLSKLGSGTAIITAPQNYTGQTSLQGGTLVINSIANNGTASALGVGGNGTADIQFSSGAVLKYIGSGNSTDRLFRFNYSNIANTGGAIDASGSGALRFTSTGTIGFSANNGGFLYLTGTSTADNTLAPVLTNTPTAVAMGLTKYGTGKWILTGNNTYTGQTRIYDGSLVLNAATGAISGSSAVAFGGGQFTIDNTGATGALTISSGTLTATAGDGVMTFARTAAQDVGITFAGNSRAAGATVNLAHGGGANSASNGFSITGATQGFVTQGLFFSGADYAYMNTTGGYVRAPVYGTDSGFVNASGSLTTGASNHNLVQSSLTGVGAGTVATIKFSGASAVNLTQNASTTLTLNNGGLLRSGGGATTISGGTISTAANAEYVFRVDSAADSLTINSVIAANNSNPLTKSGAGLLTLGGANDYTQPTYINGGTLAISSNVNLGRQNQGQRIEINNATLRATADVGLFNGTAGTNNRNVVITNAGTFEVDANRTLTIAGVVSGANLPGYAYMLGGGRLIKTGAGTLALNGANTYTGSTTITQGVLVLGNANAVGGGGDVVFNGGTLQYGSGITTDISGRIKNSTGAVAIDTGNNPLVFALAIDSSNTGGLTKSGSGSLTLSGNNTYTGTTTVASGTLILSGSGALSGSTVSLSGGTLDMGGLSLANTFGSLTGGTLANGTLTNNGSNYDLQNGTVSAVLAGNNGINKTTSGSVALSGNNTFSGGMTLTGGTLEIASTGRLGGGAYAANITNNATLVYSGANNQALSGVISGSGALTQNSSSTLTLSGNNTYTGATTINAGTLTLAGTSGAAGSGNVTIVGGALLQIDNSASTTHINNISGAGNILHTAGAGITTTLAGTNTNTGSIQSTGGGTLLFSGAGALSSNITGLSASGGSTLSFVDNSTSTITLGNSGISLSTAKLSFDVDLSSSTSDRLVFAQAASLNGTNLVNINFLNSISSGQTWTLLTATSGLNGTWSLGTYAPQTGYSFSLTSNTTSLWLTAAASSSLAYWTGGNGSSWVDTNFSTTINGTASIDGSSLTTSSDVIFASTNAGNLTTTLGANYSINTLAISTPEVAINGSNTLNVTSSSSSAINVSAAGNTTINAGLAGSAGLLKSGAGTLTLNGSNTYAGGTTIAGGTVVVGSTTALGNSSSTITLNPLSGNTATIRSGVANLTISNAFALPSGTMAFDTNSTNSTLSGNISGPGALTKIGLGILALNGSNTYTGATTIDAGTLTLSGGLSGSSVTINGGTLNQTSAGTIAGTGTTLTLSSGNATLAGANTYTGATTINAGTLALSGGLSGSNVTINGGALNQTSVGTIAGTGTTFTLSGGNATLAGTNTYTGSTTINGGTLSVSAITNGGVAGALGNSTNAVGNLVLGGGTLEYTASGNSTDRNFTLTAGTTSTISVTNSSANLTISGASATTTGALTKAGSGTLILSGNNTYTGATTINAGTLQIGANGTSGSLSSSSAIANNGSLVINRSDAVALGNIISGTGNLTKLGQGNLALSGNNTYTGVTTISSGNMTISHSNALGSTIGGTTVSANAVLELQGGISVGAEALTLTGTGIGDTGALRNMSGNNSYGGNITLAATGVRIGSASGILTLTGDLAGNNTTVRFSAGSGIVLSGNLNLGTGSLLLDSGFLTLSGSNSYSGKTGLTGGTAYINSIKNVGAGASSLGAVTTAANGVIELGSNNTSGVLVYTGNGDSTDRIIDLKGSTGSATLDQSGSGTLRFTSDFTATGAGSKTLTLQGSTAGIGEIAAAVVNNNSTNTTSLTKNGTGTWILSGANTYTGATTINTGTLQIGNGSSTGTLSASSTITNNGTIVFNRSGTFTQGTDFANGISGTGNLTQAGAGNLIINAANSYTGVTTVANGTLTLSGSGTLGTSTITITGGTLDLGGQSLTNTFSSLTGGTISNGTLSNNGGNYALQNGTVSTNLAGTNGLVKTGNGTLTLTGSNTYSGATTISAGNLSISSASALGSTSGINLANNTALIYTGGSGNLTRAISVTGTTGSTGTIRNSGTGLLTLSGALSKNGTTLTLAGGSNGITVSGVISGSAANSDLVIDGGTTTLANANDYNGPTFIINSGTLNANAAGALPTSTLSAVTINGSSTLALGASQSIASLTGATSSNVTLGANALTLGTTSGNTTYAGRITGSSSSALVKDGASTQVLTGNNSGFTGTTTVNSGTLQAAATGALGNSTVINVNGGSFLVTAENAVNDNTAINLNGGRLAVSGTLNETVGALTLSANATLDFSGFVGTLRFSGIGSWASGANLAIWNWSGQTQYGTNYGTYPNNSSLVFTNNSTLSSNLANISFYSDSGTTSIGSGFELGFTGSGGGSLIIAVPEPETYFYAVALLAGIVIQYLRRRARRKTSERHLPEFVTRATARQRDRSPG